MKLDHLLWAVPDLDAGIAQFEDLTGIRAAIGGTHPGFGTRNALASFGDTYIEIISPDPAQNLDGTLGAEFAALSAPWLYSAAFSTGDLTAARAQAARAGLAAGDIVEMSRTRPDDGVRLDWAIMKLTHPELGARFPFLIDWKGSPHPSGTTPRGLELVSFKAVSPRPDALADAFAAMDMDMAVDAGGKAGFVARLSTPKGEITLS